MVMTYIEGQVISMADFRDRSQMRGFTFPTFSTVSREVRKASRSNNGSKQKELEDLSLRLDTWGRDCLFEIGMGTFDGPDDIVVLLSRRELGLIHNVLGNSLDDSYERIVNGVNQDEITKARLEHRELVVAAWDLGRVLGLARDDPRPKLDELLDSHQ